MTKEERWKYIEILSDLRAKYSCFEESEEPYYEALSAGIKAIKALEQEPILDKIRAEIVELQKEYQEYGWAYDDALEIIDKYKAESEDKE